MVPGLKGLILFAAARGDTDGEIAEVLKTTTAEIDAILTEGEGTHRIRPYDGGITTADQSNQQQGTNVMNTFVYGENLNMNDSLNSISLLRSYTNDVYRIQTDAHCFALKIYGADWRCDSEIRYEIDLLRHLASRGVKVALPIVGRNGETLQVIEIGGHQRQAVLFEWALGSKPEPPFTPEMYFHEGKATAHLHQAMDGFTSPHYRRSLDLELLIDRPLALIESLAGYHSVKVSLRHIGDHLRRRIEELVTAGLDWGPCHGDLTFDNFHLTEDGETSWYDFDSGGPGWRAIDLQGWAATVPGRHGDWQMFLEGYQSIRPLGDNDIVAAPYLALAREVWGIQVDLERRELSQGAGAVHRFLVKAVERLRLQAITLTKEPQTQRLR